MANIGNPSMPTLDEAMEKVRKNPEVFENQALAGELLYKSNRYDEAVDHLKKAAELLQTRIDNTPPDASHVGMFPRDMVTRMHHDLYMMCGDSLVKRQKFEEAANMIREGLGMIDEDPDGWNLMGVAQANSRNLDGALRSFREAVRHNPARRDLWENLRKTYYNLRRPEVEMIANLMSDKKDLEDDMVILADLFIKGGEYPKAQQVIDTLLEWNPKDRRTLIPQSRLHIINGEYKSAITALDEILKDDKNNIDTLWHLARISAIQGDVKKSMKYLESVFDIDQNYTNGLALRQMLETYNKAERIPFGVMIHNEREFDEENEECKTVDEYKSRPELSLPIGSTFEDAMHFMIKGEFFRLTDKDKMEYRTMMVSRDSKGINFSPVSFPFPVSKEASFWSEYSDCEPLGYEVSMHGRTFIHSGGGFYDLIVPNAEYWLFRTDMHPMKRVSITMTYSLLASKAFNGR